MQLNNGVGKAECSFCRMLSVKRLFDVEGSCITYSVVGFVHCGSIHSLLKCFPLLTQPCSLRVYRVNGGGKQSGMGEETQPMGRGPGPLR